MTIDIKEMAAAVDEGRQQWEEQRTTVRQVLRYLGASQSEIAEGLGLTRQSLNGRLMGRIQFNPWELDAIAKGLGIPRKVLNGSPEDAIRWLLDHPEVAPEFRWSPLSPLRAA